LSRIIICWLRHSWHRIKHLQIGLEVVNAHHNICWVSTLQSIFLRTHWVLALHTFLERGLTYGWGRVSRLSHLSHQIFEHVYFTSEHIHILGSLLWDLVFTTRGIISHPDRTQGNGASLLILIYLHPQVLSYFKESVSLLLKSLVFTGQSLNLELILIQLIFHLANVSWRVRTCGFKLIIFLLQGPCFILHLGQRSSQFKKLFLMGWVILTSHDLGLSNFDLFHLCGHLFNYLPQLFILIL
jgi:hypothetical protein